MNNKCIYCETPNGQYEVYIVKKAYKPKGKRHRLREIGYCCEECHDKYKKPILIEYNPLEDFFCAKCNKKVNHAIVDFCMRPKNKFKILCWNCQHNMK